MRTCLLCSTAYTDEEHDAIAEPKTCGFCGEGTWSDATSDEPASPAAEAKPKGKRK